jgi:ribokinase
MARISATVCDVVVVGGANTDYLVRGPRLPAPGETVEGEVFQKAAGGKGANQAVAAARLGARVALVARVGSDQRGAALVDQLATEGVDTGHVVVGPTAASESPTGVALIMVNAQGQKQILTAPGANGRLAPPDVRAAEETIRGARVVLANLEVPLDAVGEAFRLARDAGARVVLDPAPPTDLSDELLRLVDVVRPDEAEAEALTGIRPRDRRSAQAAAERLLARGPWAAVVQAGEAGDQLVWRPAAGGPDSGGAGAIRRRWLPRLPVEVVDTTGAGDAFAAGLAVALAEGRPLEEAAVLANAAAALATTVLGAHAGLPRRAGVEALLAGGGTAGAS